MLYFGSRDTTLAVRLQLLQVDLWRQVREERGEKGEREGVCLLTLCWAILWSTTVATVEILEIPAGDKGR